MTGSALSGRTPGGREWSAQEGAAAIEANVADIQERLAVWARHMAGRFNGAVYLLGSVLHNPDPRDVDIRIVVEDHEFAARYGVPLHRIDPLPEHHPIRKRSSIVGGNFCKFDEDGPSQRWIDDVAKFTGRLSVKLNRNVDVQIVPDSWWRDRIYPAPIRLAAPSDRWFIHSAHCPDPLPPVAAAALEKTP